MSKKIQLPSERLSEHQAGIHESGSPGNELFNGAK